MMSIKLLAVPLEGQEKAFDVGKFWREIVSDQGQDDRAIIENLYDLTQHVCSLTRPTAIVVPNGRCGYITITMYRILSLFEFSCHKSPLLNIFIRLRSFFNCSTQPNLIGLFQIRSKTISIS